MIEKKYDYTVGNEKMIEKIINDDNLNINHMVLPKGEGLPIHYSNSNVYMIIIRGRMAIELDDQPAQEYTKGNIVNIPFNIKMNVQNLHDDILEFFVVKAPNPKDMGK